MKLVTTRKNWSILGPEYVPGKCNIGKRGRTIRLTTGLLLIVISIVLGLIVLKQFDRLLRLVLVLPAYVGFLSVLEGTTSFCVLHARRGTYDMREPMGYASSRSATLAKVESEDWKRVDRQKALRMHLESLAGAIVLAMLLAFA